MSISFAPRSDFDEEDREEIEAYLNKADQIHHHFPVDTELSSGDQQTFSIDTGHALGEYDDDLRPLIQGIDHSGAEQGLTSYQDHPTTETSGESQSNEMARRDNYVPPDGGCWAWTVLFCSFMCNGIVFGIVNSSGQIFEALVEMYHKQNDPDAATKASLVGSMQIGATFALSPVSGILADKFGIRRTAFFGGFIATLGVFLSSFCIDNLQALCFTYGIMFGSGASLVYTPSLAIIGHYFKKRLGIANGIVAAGSPTVSMVLPHLLAYVLKKVSIAIALRLLTIFVAFLMLAALSFKPQLPQQIEEDTSELHGDKRRSKCYRLASKVVYFKNWKNIKYVIWTMAVPTALFGYFVPYIHIIQYVKDLLPDDQEDANGRILITCISATSFLGRLVFGRVADHPQVNCVVLQQLALVVIGSCTMLLVAAQYFGWFTFYALVIFILFMGIFDGCFITMFGPIAYKICGPQGASQGIGFILGLNSISLTIGPVVAGVLYDQFGNYTLAFILAGIPPIVGALLMCIIHKVGNSNSLDPSQEVSQANNEEGDRILRQPVERA